MDGTLVGSKVRLWAVQKAFAMAANLALSSVEPRVTAMVVKKAALSDHWMVQHLGGKLDVQKVERKVRH